jgi:poly(A) polymerase
MDSLSEIPKTLRWLYSSFSALDRYYHLPQEMGTHLTVFCDLVTLAREVSDLEFPGLAYADAAAWADGSRVYFQCIDDLPRPPQQTFRTLNLLYDPEKQRYVDPYDDYRALRSAVLEPTDYPHDPLQRLMDAAVCVSRYPQTIDTRLLEPIDDYMELPTEALRRLLSGVLTGTKPWEGLRLLKEFGFVEAYWPELAAMEGTAHSKEHHPEGDVWTHSLETFRYRRSNDLVLTLALLLHDSGKPRAVQTAQRRFDQHAEIGGRLATRLLRRMRYGDDVVDSVRWLIANHMYPGALHRLPTRRTSRLMNDQLFPLLLEIYRCDLESTYRPPEGYYRACKIYRDFLRNSANPFRTPDGKKLLRLYVS